MALFMCLITQVTFAWVTFYLDQARAPGWISSLQQHLCDPKVGWRACKKNQCFLHFYFLIDPLSIFNMVSKQACFQGKERFKLLSTTFERFLKHWVCFQFFSIMLKFSKLYLFSSIVLLTIMASTFDAQSIKKLNGNNFHTWKMKMKFLLHEKNLWSKSSQENYCQVLDEELNVLHHLDYLQSFE